LTPFPRDSYNAADTPTDPLTKGIQPIGTRLRAVLTAIAGLLLLSARAGASEPIRTAAQDLRGATFDITPTAARFDTVRVDGAAYERVSMPGAPAVALPGLPSLPVLTVPFGVPDGMTAKLRIVSADWDERPGLPPLPVMKQRYVADDPKTGPVSEERFDPDPSVYGKGQAYPGEAASLGEGGPVGDLWMIPAVVRPVRYDFGKKRYLVLRHMTVRVEFVPATAAQLKQRPAVRPGAEAGVWQKVQHQLLKNSDAVRMFPRRASGLPPRLAPRAARAGAVNPEFRIAVTTTGWSSVSYATLSAAGFPTGVSIAQIGVWQRGYDDVGDSATSTPIPVVARDANTNGTFDAGDAITFYAQNLRDRLGPASIENRYSHANVYWLTWTGSTASVPGTISGVIADPSPAMPVSFYDTLHLEQNNHIMPWPNSTIGSPSENVEYMFWTDGFDPDQFSTPIPFVHPNTDSLFRIQSRYQGKAGPTHAMDIVFKGSSSPPDTLASKHLFYGQDIYVLDTGFSIPGSHIGNGSNAYQHYGFAQFGGNPTFIPGSYSFLDWVDVTYSRRFIADQNRIEFTSGSAAGIVELHVQNFTQPAVEVYDVTDPTAPLTVTGVVVNPVGGTFEAVFRTDASGGTRRFVALVAGGEIAIAAGSVKQDTPSALRDPAPFPPGAFARAILIVPPEFIAPANRLADFRRTQGYVVEVATTQDVYDEFSGGIKSGTAIRRYFQHAYNVWSPRPSFAALLGDGSLDYRHDMPASGADWVPTYLAFESVAGPNGAQLAAMDPVYVLNLGGGGTTTSQATPSIFLGRVPASSASELDQYVTKVIQYENFQPADTWRGRQLLFSDDDYSTTIFFTGGYCQQSGEALFQLASERMADTTAASPSGQDIQSVLFKVKDFTDRFSSCQIPSTTCRNQACVQNAMRGIGGPVDSFMTEISKGSLIFNIESHANRYLLAHELIYYPATGDLARIQNVGRPNVFFAWGCHVNQFPDAPNGPADIDSSDAIGEQWITLPNAGSVAGLGFTAFELIDTNAAMNDFVATAFYSTPPAPPPLPGQARQARWILGEVVGQAYVRNANSNFFLQQAMNRTMNLFGDPMLRMDALPPRIFNVLVNGVPVQDNSPFVTDSPTDSVSIMAMVRDEAGLKKTDLAERDLATGTVTPYDSTRYSVAVSDTGRANTLNANVRPHVGNYDLLVRSFDRNNRESDFALQVRSTVRYLANGIVIVNGAFVEASSTFRAEVTTPIPVTADSLTLLLDGLPVPNVTETVTDATGRHWALTTLPQALLSGTHTLDVEVNGRSGIFPQASFLVGSEFTMRGVAVVSPRLMGAGCDGSVFQFELSTPAPKVELLLMTVAGRRVASLEWPGKAGFNVFCWDGRDSRGNTTAIGLYFYRLTATDAAGHRVTQSGRMIRSR